MQNIDLEIMTGFRGWKEDVESGKRCGPCTREPELVDGDGHECYDDYGADLVKFCAYDAGYRAGLEKAGWKPPEQPKQEEWLDQCPTCGHPEYELVQVTNNHGQCYCKACGGTFNRR